MLGWRPPPFSWHRQTVRCLRFTDVPRDHRAPRHLLPWRESLREQCHRWEVSWHRRDTGFLLIPPGKTLPRSACLFGTDRTRRSKRGKASAGPRAPEACTDRGAQKAGPRGEQERVGPAAASWCVSRARSPARFRTELPGLEGACKRPSHPEPLFRRAAPSPPLPPRNQFARHRGTSSFEVPGLGARINRQRGDPKFGYRGQRGGNALDWPPPETARGRAAASSAGSLRGLRRARWRRRGGAPRAGGPGACTWRDCSSRPPAGRGTALVGAEGHPGPAPEACLTPGSPGAGGWEGREDAARRERLQRGDYSVGSRRARRGAGDPRGRESQVAARGAGKQG